MEFLTTLDRERIAALLQRDEYFWLDLEAPGEDDVRQVGEVFGFHRLAIEDSTKFGQRPKFEDYDGHVFVVFYGAQRPSAGAPELIEVHIYVSGSYVVTLHRSLSEDLERVRARLQEQSGESEQFVVYKLFDALTDSFFPVLAQIDEEIDGLEEALGEDPQPEDRRHIVHLRRLLVNMRRRIAPQRDMFARQMDEIVSLPGLERGARDYFRDVYDHLLRVVEEIDSYRDLLSGSMDIYLSAVSNRTNEVMRQLTVIATIFLPLTFVTGFFGQNFGWLVEHVDTELDFLIYGVGAMLLTMLGLLALFRLRHWI